MVKKAVVIVPTYTEQPLSQTAEDSDRMGLYLHSNEYRVTQLSGAVTKLRAFAAFATIEAEDEVFFYFSGYGQSDSHGTRLLLSDGSFFYWEETPTPSFHAEKNVCFINCHFSSAETINAVGEESIFAVSSPWAADLAKGRPKYLITSLPGLDSYLDAKRGGSALTNQFLQITYRMEDALIERVAKSLEAINQSGYGEAKACF